MRPQLLVFHFCVQALPVLFPFHYEGLTLKPKYHSFPDLQSKSYHSVAVNCHQLVTIQSGVLSVYVWRRWSISEKSFPVAVGKIIANLMINQLVHMGRESNIGRKRIKPLVGTERACHYQLCLHCIYMDPSCHPSGLIGLYS